MATLEEIEEELAKHELDIVERLVAEVKRLRWAKWELTNNYAELQTEVKRLREENERLKEDIKRFESFRQPQSTVHKDW